VLPTIAAPESFPVLPESSRFHKSLSEHAHLVEFVLRAAKAVFANVAIVTLSMSPWVPFSASRYLPGVDIDELLSELNIPVYYSRGHYDEMCKKMSDSVKRWRVELLPSGSGSVGLKLRKQENGGYEVIKVSEQGLVATWNQANPSNAICMGDVIFDINGKSRSIEIEFRNCMTTRQPAILSLARQTSDCNPHIEAKRIDMAKCLQKFYGGMKDASWNVVSVGDSMAEHEALKQVLSQVPNAQSNPLCKTVHLLDKPAVEQLSNELRVLLVWLPRILQFDQAFDLDMHKLHELETDLLAKAAKS